jgi:transposase-like protein
MKRKYQKKLAKSSSSGAGNEDMICVPLDRIEVQRLLSEGLHEFALEMSRQVAVSLLEDEVLRLCGKAHVPVSDRQMTRHGHQSGWVAIAGQKLTVPRPRVRYTIDRGEVALPTYALLQQSRSMTEAVRNRMIRGVSCRNYEAVVNGGLKSFGIKRSSVSRAFKAATVSKVKRFSERRWDGVRFAAIYIDGTDYAGETMIVALGLKADGTKQILGLRQGATEKADVCKDLLFDLWSRGVATDQVTLFVLDGAKALRAGVEQVWGSHAVFQRCQVHKRRNVKAYLAQEYWPGLDRRLSEAYRERDYNRALSLLRATKEWLSGINPSAAHSLEEGLEETITVIRLGVPELLQKSLSSTDVIESALGTSEGLTGRVKRWRRGHMRWRWCASGLLLAEAGFHRVQGYREIPKLIKALDDLAQERGLEVNRQVA